MDSERRTFIVGCGGAACSAALSVALGCDLFNPRDVRAESSRGAEGFVVIARDPNSVQTLSPNAARVQRLVDESVRALVGATTARDAWNVLFNPRDIVGIKVNTLAGLGLSSSLVVVEAIVRGLRLAGVAFTNIVVWDRDTAELGRAGFRINRSESSTYQCYGTDAAGLTESLYTNGRVGSLLSRILTDRITKLINVPILKDHDLSGVGIGMKNLYGCIHNPNRYHDNNCDPYVANVSAFPVIRTKLQLVLCDALRPQCHGGPALVRQHQWAYGGVLAGRDPVALDAVGCRIIEEERARRGLATLTEAHRPPRWLQTAQSMGLGVADLSRVRTEEV